MTEKKTDRRVRYTKMLLRNALLNLMKEKPIGSITPTELCRDADVNRNTFYAHYSSPSDVLSEIEEELYDDILKCMQSYSGDKLRLDDICRAIKEYSGLCTVILSDYGDMDFLVRLIDSVRDITAAEWRARAPQATDAEIENYFLYCTNGSVGVVRKWVNDGMKMSVEQVAQVLENANMAILTMLCAKNK